MTDTCALDEEAFFNVMKLDAADPHHWVNGGSHACRWRHVDGGGERIARA